MICNSLVIQKKEKPAGFSFSFAKLSICFR